MGSAGAERQDGRGSGDELANDVGRDRVAQEVLHVADVVGEAQEIDWQWPWARIGEMHS